MAAAIQDRGVVGAQARAAAFGAEARMLFWESGGLLRAMVVVRTITVA
jgi:hypothetical protein